MRTLTKHLTRAVVLVAGAAGVASGNAFNINEHDGRVTGRGGAVAASDTDASSVVFNPGGIPVAEGTQVIVDGTLYVAKGSYQIEGENRVKTTSQPQPVPALFVTSRVHDLVAVGFGVHFPFGLSVEWPINHPQANVVQEISLRTYYLTPSVGINLDKYVPGLSIGGGVDIVPATVELRRAIQFGDVTGEAHLGGDAVGFGGRVGVMYHPRQFPKLKAGLMYRSRVKLDFDGEGDFDIEQPFRDQLPPDGDISTTLIMPQAVTGGVAYTPIDNLEVELNVQWTNWSVFKELRIELPADQESVAPEDYQNTTTLRLGVDYAMPQYKTALRAGVIYDPTPIPATTQTAQLPDVNRLNVTLGTSYYFGDYAAHLGLLLVTPRHRDTSDELYMPFVKANYGVWAFVTALSVSGTFGAGASPAPPPAMAAQR